jgi:hypothetical protein
MPADRADEIGHALSMGLRLVFPSKFFAFRVTKIPQTQRIEKNLNRNQGNGSRTMRGVAAP